MKNSRKKTRKIQSQQLERDAGYPSLMDHLMSRRKFLSYAGVAAAAGGVAAACGRNLGTVEGDGGFDDKRVDGGTEPDSEIQMMGVIAEPEYYNLRIPESGETTAYLAEGGKCRFYVNAVTYSASTYELLRENPGGSQAATRKAIVGFTYDELKTDEGFDEAERAIYDSLLDLVEEWSDGEDAQIEAVSLFITHLEPELHIDGGDPEPEYP